MTMPRRVRVSPRPPAGAPHAGFQHRRQAAETGIVGGCWSGACVLRSPDSSAAPGSCSSSWSLGDSPARPPGIGPKGAHPLGSAEESLGVAGCALPSSPGRPRLLGPGGNLAGRARCGVCWRATLVSHKNPLRSRASSYQSRRMSVERVPFRGFCKE